jgi:hypothetical protein
LQFLLPAVYSPNPEGYREENLSGRLMTDTNRGRFFKTRPRIDKLDMRTKLQKTSPESSKI